MAGLSPQQTSVSSAAFDTNERIFKLQICLSVCSVAVISVFGPSTSVIPMDFQAPVKLQRTANHGPRRFFTPLNQRHFGEAHISFFSLGCPRRGVREGHCNIKPQQKSPRNVLRQSVETTAQSDREDLGRTGLGAQPV
jgi:hypothetical protein